MTHPLPRNPGPALLPKRLRDDGWWLAPTSSATIITFPERCKPYRTSKEGRAT